MLSYSIVVIKNMNLLDVLKEAFSENIKVSTTDISFEISQLLKTTILRKNRTTLVLVC